jgi:type IV conjugative transfer system protein TraL
MTQLNNHVILGHIDKPVRILFWPAGQFFMCILPLLAGFVLDHALAGLLMFLITALFFKMFNKRFGKGQFQAVLYWYLPTSKRLVRLGIPPSHVRIWLR